MSRGGEIALLALTGLLTLVALAALLGVAAAALLFGGGWVWPSGRDTVGQVLGGLLAGEPRRGFSAASAERLPAPVTIYAGVALAELLMLAISTAAGRLLLRYRRPGDARRGMATRTEAAQVLGRRRLRGARGIIRPDLHDARRRR